MKKLIDFADPFFAPVWIRVCVVAVCAVWGLFEMANGNTGWGALFLGLGALSAWRFWVNDYTADKDG